MASVLQPLAPSSTLKFKKVPSGGTPEGQVARLEATYTPHDQRFTLRRREFKQQYSHIYARRLARLRAAAAAEAERLWGGDQLRRCERLVQANADGAGGSGPCVCIGTLYKTMRLRPSVLVEYRDERGISEAIGVPRGDFAAPDDSLLLEDDSGRLNLAADTTTPDVMPAQDLPTGIVVAVRGSVRADGDMAVEAWCPPGLPPQPSPPEGAAHPPGACLLLVSGMLAGGPQDPLPTRLFLDHLAGYLGGAGDHEQIARVVRVVVCGNSAAAPPPPLAGAASGSIGSGKLSAEQQRERTAPLRECDAELAQVAVPVDIMPSASDASNYMLPQRAAHMLFRKRAIQQRKGNIRPNVAAALPVDIMPGASDASNYMLPQQPLHPCLLPLASRYPNARLATNPHEAWVGTRLVLGTAGQPLDDILQYTAAAEGAGGDEGDSARRLQMLENMLRWQHIAPTAPDTLGCYPFLTEDPFVLEECPHVFFAGNQPRFATRLVEGHDGQQKGLLNRAAQVRVVCVPSFATTGEVVLIDLDTLEATPLQFGVSDLGGWETTGPADMAEE
ncbi:DNA polymerase alpha/epsilon subunit B-domain-containing protein [Tribonema minus]|uniref:DNA polymerase alpha/epsilon subunit B-domain-containing protein n=1 Tax=Tribonema minus TaxID=303371 RepID=A0A835YHI6_9STRA|nr:DNA polymerase alpha/epsilon subunit B-domain-containing protein [Tribonema minus]